MLSTQIENAVSRAAGTFNSGVVEVPRKVEGGHKTANVSLWVNVTAISGTLDLTIQWSNDGTNFFDADTTADSMAQITTVTGKSKQFVAKAPYFRVKEVVGTTSATYSLWANFN